MLKERYSKIHKDPKLRKVGCINKIPSIGDVVLLVDDNNKLQQLSRIVDVDTSKDGEIRSVKVVHKGQSDATWWPLRKISFLEVGNASSIPLKFTVQKDIEKIKIPTR